MPQPSPVDFINYNDANTIMIKASVIIPVYNGESFIEETIRSVLTQTISPDSYEIIVINDGSTDSSADIIKNFRNDIVYISQENLGVSAARNVGIQTARGDYIAFLDQDDLFRSDKLEKMIGFLDNNPRYGMVYSLLARVDHSGKPMQPKKIPCHMGDIFPHLFMKSYIYPSMVLCRKTAIYNAGFFQDKFSSRGEDSDFFLRVALKNEVGMIGEHLSIYRSHGSNVSKNIVDIMPFAQEEILAQFKHDLLNKYPLGWWIYRRKMSKTYREQAKTFFSQGNYDQAKSRISASFRIFPFRLDVAWLLLRFSFLHGLRG